MRKPPRESASQRFGISYPSYRDIARAFLFVTVAGLSLPAIAQTRIDCVASIIDGNSI